MPNSKPIPYRFYQDLQGRTYSPFSSFIPPGAEEVVKGWTVQHQDGTTGIGRAPFETEADAQAWCDANPNFSGMGRLYD